MNATVPLLCQAHNLPQPTPEFRFAPPRRWRLDYAWVDRLIALEVEGGVFVQGRHSRGVGMLNDMSKYNAAAILGWRIVRCTPKQVQTGEIAATLKEIL